MNDSTMRTRAYAMVCASTARRSWVGTRKLGTSRGGGIRLELQRRDPDDVAAVVVAEEEPAIRRERHVGGPAVAVRVVVPAAGGVRPRPRPYPTAVPPR